MKILFVTTTLGTRGGIQRVTTVKANCFAEMPGNEVAIAFSDRLGWPENAIHPLSEKVKVYDMECPFWDRVPRRFDILYRFPKKAFALRQRIRRVIEDFKPDIVISTGQFEKYILPFVHLFKREYVIVREYHFSSNYRQIEYRVRNGKDSIKPKLINFFENKVVAPLFDCNYLLTKQDKIENHASNRKFGYMWNPSSFEICDSSVLTQKKPIVVACGRLTKQKNFQDLLQIWAETNRKDWKLRILGDGEDMPMLKRLANELNISDSVELVGYSSNIKQELQDASIIAATSTFEGFMLVLAEAMSQGCVPISYETPYGPRDIITDGVDGYLTPPYCKQMYISKLGELIEADADRATMALSALSRANDFDISAICNQWITEYNRLLANKKHS